MYRLPFERLLIGLIFTATCGSALADGASSDPLVRLHGAGTSALAQSQVVASVSDQETLSLEVVLPWRNRVELNTLIKSLYTPKDPHFHKFLNSKDFINRFAPTEADYDAVSKWVRDHGMRVTRTTANRHLLRFDGAVGDVSRALNVRFARYRTRDGRVVRATLDDPQIESSIASRITGITGLSEAPHYHTYAKRPMTSGAAPIGSGPGGGLSPSDIKVAYNLGTVPEDGTGETIAVLELAPYTLADVAAYDTYFGLPQANQNIITVDTAPIPNPAGGGVEATLDVELISAIAPKAKVINVYETLNADPNISDAYNQIAIDDTANQISTSWGLDEPDSLATDIESEYDIFAEYAVQGQCLYAAAGDSGAYDDGFDLSVDDPASQPDVVGVGGTSLTTTGPGGSWKSESAWSLAFSLQGQIIPIVSVGGGGGISEFWPIPSYQSTILGASTSLRNVPDVSLDADPNTGYAIYDTGAWILIGGTSCAAPIWTGMTALINERRTNEGVLPLGFANPALYALYNPIDYTQAFHDIGDGSNNLYYTADIGYDNATGLGTPQGANLVSLLAPGPTATGPAAPTGLTAKAGDGKVFLQWSPVLGVATYYVYREAPGDTTFNRLATVSAPSFIDTSVTNGDAYTYVVTALNNTGESPYSNQASATPTATAGTVPFPKGINFISLPFNYNGQTPNTIFGYPGATLFIYNAATSSYIQTPNAPANTPTPGLGYWVKFPSAVSAEAGTPVDPTQDYSITLQAGWNMIGDPFTSSVPVSSLQVVVNNIAYPFTNASQNHGFVQGVLYQYNQSANNYITVVSSGAINPDSGYWIFAAQPVRLIVPHP